MRTIEINKVVESRRLFNGLDADGAKIVKMRELHNALQAELKKSKEPLILVGHLAADLDMHYNICVVTRLSLSKLSTILKKRRYSKEKTRENLFAEALDYCGVEAESRADEIYEVETQRDKRKLMLYIKLRAGGKRAKRPKIAQISKMGELQRGIMNGDITP